MQKKYFFSLLLYFLCLFSYAAIIVPDHVMIDLSNGTHRAGSTQTIWDVADGTVISVNDAHWSNSAYYYIGYMFDKSYTYNPVTGAYNTGSNGYAVNGYLSNSADEVQVTVTFPTSVPVSMMRFYPSGWSNTFLTDYKVEYRNTSGVFQQALARQTVVQSQVPSGVDSKTIFYDHTMNVTSQVWRITLTNGEGGWQGNATFGEIQFFKSAVTPPTLFSSNTNFGNIRVGTSGTAEVSVTNTGASGSSLTGTIGSSSNNDIGPTSGTQNFSLGQNQTATRSYTYTPSSRGFDSTTINISSNAGNSSQTLTGTGVSPVYSSSVAPNTTIDFGIVDKDQTLTQTLTIQNTTPDDDLGNLTNLTLLSANISGDDASYFALNNFTPGTVLSKNQLLNLLISVSNPDHLVSYRRATLTIVTDENAALGIAGNTYTYDLVAYTVPEISTHLFMSMAFLFAIVQCILKKYK